MQNSRLKIFFKLDSCLYTSLWFKYCVPAIIHCHNCQFVTQETSLCVHICVGFVCVCVCFFLLAFKMITASNP